MADDTTAQERLRVAVTASGRVDFTQPDDPHDLTTVDAGTWTTRTLPAETLRAAILEVAKSNGMPFELVGAWVVGSLDLQALTLPRIFALRRCILEDIDLNHAVAGKVDLSGCHVRGSLKAGDINVAGELALRGITVDDETNLESARIDGTTDLREASLHSREPNALILAGARVGGSVRLNDACVDGVIMARGVRIDGRLVLQGATVHGRRREDLDPHAPAEPRFGTTSPASFALIAEHAVIRGAVHLSSVSLSLQQRSTASTNSASFTGQVSFFAAEIGGHLVGDHAYLCTEGGYALNLETALVGGAVLLRGACLHGGVRLYAAQITAGLECDDGLFTGGRRNAAVDARLCKVSGPVNLGNGFHAEGGVLLQRATIAGGLNCTAARLHGRPPSERPAEDSAQSALNLRDATIGGNVYLSRPFAAYGEVVLRGATVTASVNAVGGLFYNPHLTALDAAGLHVDRELDLREATVTGDLTLAHAQVTSYFDDRRSWPGNPQSDDGEDAAPASVDLEGFRYESLRSPDLSWKVRRDWLRLQQQPQRPQPFLQLASAYRAGGMEREARKILIARHNEAISLRNPWRQVLRFTVGHGYEPLRALLIALVLLISGGVIFDYAARHEMLVPTRTTTAVSSNCDATNYPCVSPYVYSLDTLLPVINLRQRDYWTPDPERGRWVAIFSWGSTILGWVLGLLVIAGFSGFVRRE